MYQYLSTKLVSTGLSLCYTKYLNSVYSQTLDESNPQKGLFAFVRYTKTDFIKKGQEKLEKEAKTAVSKTKTEIQSKKITKKGEQKSEKEIEEEKEKNEKLRKLKQLAEYSTSVKNSWHEIPSARENISRITDKELINRKSWIFNFELFTIPQMRFVGNTFGNVYLIRCVYLTLLNIIADDAINFKPQDFYQKNSEYLYPVYNKLYPSQLQSLVFRSKNRLGKTIKNLSQYGISSKFTERICELVLGIQYLLWASLSVDRKPFLISPSSEKINFPLLITNCPLAVNNKARLHNSISKSILDILKEISVALVWNIYYTVASKSIPHNTFVPLKFAVEGEKNRTNSTHNFIYNTLISISNSIRGKSNYDLVSENGELHTLLRNSNWINELVQNYNVAYEQIYKKVLLEKEKRPNSKLRDIYFTTDPIKLQNSQSTFLTKLIAGDVTDYFEALVYCCPWDTFSLNMSCPVLPDNVFLEYENTPISTNRNFVFFGPNPVLKIILHFFWTVTKYSLSYKNYKRWIFQ